MNLFRRKSVTELQAEALTDHSLKRALGALNLTLLGIGAIIGTGIFVLTGTVAALNSGPAVVFPLRADNTRDSRSSRSSARETGPDWYYCRGKPHSHQARVLFLYPQSFGPKLLVQRSR